MSKSKLLKAVCNTILETGEVERDALSDYDASRYASTDAYYRAVRGAMADNGLVIFPARVCVSVDEEGGSPHLVQLFRLEHVSGESREIPAPPWPLYDETQEKVSDKALMGAALNAQMRSVLGELFLLPVEIGIPPAYSGDHTVTIKAEDGPAMSEPLRKANRWTKETDAAPSLEETVGPHPFGGDDCAAPKARSKAMEKMREAIEAKGRIKFQATRDPISAEITEDTGVAHEGSGASQEELEELVDTLEDSLADHPADPRPAKQPGGDSETSAGGAPEEETPPLPPSSSGADDEFPPGRTLGPRVSDDEGTSCPTCGSTGGRWHPSSPRLVLTGCVCCDPCMKSVAPNETCQTCLALRTKIKACLRCGKEEAARLGVCRRCWDNDTDPMLAMEEMQAVGK